jgi:hypothetical protein
MSATRKLPIGIQDFEDLRTNGYLYVDKTAYVYRLATMGKPYFLGRPRRFGKSLFLSTLKAYFLGKKELFDGLAIAGLEEDWTEYPVLYIDMSVESYTDLTSLYKGLDKNLRRLEQQWGKDEADTTPASRLLGLIDRAYEKTGRKAVVLVDEYDKPLVNTLDNTKVNDNMREALKGFYGILKGADANLRFVFLTGVTKFSKVSVFSDLNHLVDISLREDYAGICGISESELIAYFQPEIQCLADKRKLTYRETLAELKKRYDGYHFSENSEGMYNPFSLLNTLDQKVLKNYWFETGTPTFLVKMLENINFDIKSLENAITIPANSIVKYRAENSNPVSLLYQSGYLTIKDYDAILNEYTLGFPNEEVKYGFFEELLYAYMPEKDMTGEFSVTNFVRDLWANNVDGFMIRIQAFFAGIPYDLDTKEEKHFQKVFYLLFELMGQFVTVEPHFTASRADAVVMTKDTVYVFEFKIAETSTAEKALQQIDDKGYTIPYSATGKQIVKIGVEFSREKRRITDWETRKE